MAKFANRLDNAVTFTAGGRQYTVPPKWKIELHDDIAYVVADYGLPLVPVTGEQESKDPPKGGK